ncbi:IS4 family transposase [Amaricoccus sp.]|uniref:IS4 family transposase n=1 Tax=Amaricoccus sp. TaxID=1872485 RepID=UPI001B5AB14B|nr:IS4 family transposase [Amaricoccus sp.]MBP7000764.1 IS4 family transposase [Amaricoccus sp.]
MRQALSSGDGWAEVVARLGTADDLAASARDAGALTRRRGVADASSLLRLGLCYGPGGMSLRETAAWAQMQGIAKLSDVALLKRLRGAADWFGHLAGRIVADRASASDRLGQRPLRLVDGTAVGAPGRGGAGWRLHMSYDPRASRFTDFELTDGSEAERLDRFEPETGEIRVADRGFGHRPDCIRHLAEGPGDYVVRVHWRGLHWLEETGDRFDVMGFLEGLGNDDSGEARVLIGRGKRQGSWEAFPARLVALRLPPEKAEQARARVRSENRRKGRAVQPQTLAAAGHVLLLTSLASEDYPAEHIAALYRLRWQVEIAFKRLKRLLRLDTLRARDPDLARAWIFANLLAAFLIEDMLRLPPDSSPSTGP